MTMHTEVYTPDETDTLDVIHEPASLVLTPTLTEGEDGRSRDSDGNVYVRTYCTCPDAEVSA